MTSQRLFSIVIALALAACSEPTVDVGRVDVAIVATGADGATYRLPAGTRLFVSDLNGFSDRLSLDGDAASVSFDVPPGTYQLQLRDAGNTMPASWPLQRRKPDGTTEEVLATLALPPVLSVVASETTALVIRFTVATGEIIEFAEGTIVATVEVDETAATSYDLELDEQLVIDTADTFADAPAALLPRLPAAGTAVTVHASAHVVGPWRQRSTRSVCATAEIRDASAGGSPALTDHVQESRLPQAEVCLISGTASTDVRIVLRQFIAASTATFIDFADRAIFLQTELHFSLPTVVFDGHRLDLTRLQGSHAGNGMVILQASGSAVGVPDPTYAWYDFFLLGGATLAVTPR